MFSKINDSENEYEKVFSKKLLEDISVNQENYLPDKIDGFSICRVNRIILNMKNSRFQDEKGVSGIIHFQQILKTMI
jgi:hypothetical protein